jgi:DUF2971 family protein
VVIIKMPSPFGLPERIPEQEAEINRMLGLYYPILSDCFPPHKEKDEVLYHYTTPSATESILRSGVLRASDVRFLNDRSEAQLVNDLIAAEVDKQFDQGQKTPAQLAAMRSISESIESEWQPSIYVASFSAAPDMLSQWRGYAPSGFALGFSKHQLNREAAQYGYTLSPVIYDPLKQNQIVEQFVVLAGTKWDRPSHIRLSEDLHRQAHRTALDVFRVQMIPLLKHRKFIEEQEWRLVSRYPRDTEPLERGTYVSGRYLIPFEEIPIRMFYSSLRELMIGPPSDDDTLAAGVRRALELYGFTKNEVQITRSDIPFRTR